MPVWQNENNRLSIRAKTDPQLILHYRIIYFSQLRYFIVKNLLATLTFVLLWVITSLLPTTFAFPNDKFVVIITIDGLRPDAINEQNSPNLMSFLKIGSYSLRAKTVKPSITLSAHTSLITGLSPDIHQMKSHGWNPSMDYVKHKTIFSIAKEHNLRTAMFVGKSKLKYLAKTQTVNYFNSSAKSPNSVQEIASRFSIYFEKEKPQLSLVHFPQPDSTGHLSGWMSDDYFEALKQVDNSIGFLIESVIQTIAKDEFMIIITSDHGGLGKGHIKDLPANQTIPWIAFGKEVKKGYKLADIIIIYDTAPTVLYALGMPIPNNLDGKIIREIFIE